MALSLNVILKFLPLNFPSGRKLFYRDPCIRNSSKGEILCYYGINQETNNGVYFDTEASWLKTLFKQLLVTYWPWSMLKRSYCNARDEEVA